MVAARSKSHEEKETDVNIAIHLVKDVFTDQLDRALIISADSDLVPAVQMAMAHNPTKQMSVFASPRRFGRARDLRPTKEITVGQVRKNLLPETMTGRDGQPVKRPAEYDLRIVCRVLGAP